MIRSITLIGAGNLATQLGKALKKAGLEIVQVYSRTEQSAKELALLLNADFTNNTNEINLTSDLIIIAIKDGAITNILSKLDCRNTFIVHTAGSIPMSLLSNFSTQYGVFYPLQTFSKSRDVNFQEIPLCLEASSPDLLEELKKLAGLITGNIHEIDSIQRETLHVSAVFANNFVNHLYFLSDQLLEMKGVSFDLLKPLIKETAAKVEELSPYDAQTGPAKRFDETIINKHIKLLDKQPELRKIYSFVSESIFQAHKKSDNDIL